MKKSISCAVICAAAFGAGVLICPAPASGAAHDITAISRQAGAPEQNGLVREDGYCRYYEDGQPVTEEWITLFSEYCLKVKLFDYQNIWLSKHHSTDGKICQEYFHVRIKPFCKYNLLLLTFLNNRVYTLYCRITEPKNQKNKQKKTGRRQNHEEKHFMCCHLRSSIRSRRADMPGSGIRCRA